MSTPRRACAQDADKDAKDAKDAKEKKAPKYDLVTWGQLKPVKGQAGFFEISYTKVEKRKRKKHTAFIKLGDDLKVLQDRRLTSTKLQIGIDAYVLGKQREQSTVSADGVEVTDWSFGAVEAILVGRGLKVNEDYRGARDKGVRWHKTATVEGKNGPWVTFEENKHRLQITRGTILIERGSAEASTLAKAKKGFYALILANDTEDRPETKKKSDAKKGAFETNRVILLDPTAVKQGLYYKIYE